MGNFDKWLSLLTACVPILVALVTIIPTIISNRKKTQSTIEAMEAKISGENAETRKQVSTLQESFNSHVNEYEENKAKQARYRILRFYDEVCASVDHSESNWEDILDDIDFYETYCETHKDFKNNRGSAAMEHLKETYKKVKAKGGFLTHKGE